MNKPVTKLIVHSVASLFPEMSPDEYVALKADIATNGQHEPIWLHEGRIVDGRHRYRACCELDIEPKVRNLINGASVVSLVVSENLHRRHLTSSQKAAVAVEAAEFLEAEEKAAKERQKQSGGKTNSSSKAVSQIVDQPKPNENKSTERAAKLVGSNRQYVSDAKNIKAKAPDLHAEVHSGKKTLPKARNELRKREKLAQLELKAANASLSHEEPQWTLIHADVIDGLASVRDHHAAPRLIFADPPYNIGVDYGEGEKADKLPHDKYQLWFADWINLCWEIIADDGSLWVMICDEYAAEYAVALKRTGFTIRSWVKWYETFGVNCSNNFNRTSRHIFYCVRNPKSFVFNAESESIRRQSDRAAKYNDKRAPDDGKKIWDDVWQIPRLTGTCEERIPMFPTQLPLALVQPIVECASEPGDLVVDPFSGSATTGVAAIITGRRFVGIEKSEVFIDLADKRLRGAM